MIREAEAKDRGIIEELYRMLIPNDDRIQVLEERIEQIKKDANNFIWVYESEGQVIGTALLHYCLDPMYGNQPFAVIENIIVDPRRRAFGVGKALLSHIENCCRDACCSEIHIMSHLQRKEAHHFFEKQGFHHESKGFKKYIP